MVVTGSGCSSDREQYVSERREEDWLELKTYRDSARSIYIGTLHACMHTRCFHSGFEWLAKLHTVLRLRFWIIGQTACTLYFDYYKDCMQLAHSCTLCFEKGFELLAKLHTHCTLIIIRTACSWHTHAHCALRKVLNYWPNCTLCFNYGFELLAKLHMCSFVKVLNYWPNCTLILCGLLRV